MVVVLCPLAEYWSMTGDHSRVAALTDPVTAILNDWDPPQEFADHTRFAMGTILMNVRIDGSSATDTLRNRLARLGIGGNEPRIDALVAVVLSDVPDDLQETMRRMEKLCRHSDRLVSAMALLWMGFLRESV